MALTTTRHGIGDTNHEELAAIHESTVAELAADMVMRARERALAALAGEGRDSATAQPTPPAADPSAPVLPGNVLALPLSQSTGDLTDPRATAPARTQRPGPASAGGERVRGALQDLVLAHLKERPGEDFTGTAIAKALDRSTGAVGNALDRLADTGKIAQTGTAPKRYAWTQDNH